MRKFTRKIKSDRKSRIFTKVQGHAVRICSAIFVIALMAVMSIWGFKSSQESVLAEGTVTRGVVSSLSQLPQYGNLDNVKAERGTTARPLVILEVVPYEEYAEIGYLIDGCEPVDVDNMFGHAALNTINSLSKNENSSPVVQCTVDFFTDEKEGDSSMYDSGVVGASPNGTVVKGYYEIVASGEGNLELSTVSVTDDAGNVAEQLKVVPSTSETANIVWHSVNPGTYREADLGGTIEYVENPDYSVLNTTDTNVRLYTTRTVSDQEPAIHTNSYWDYKGSNLFLQNTLELTAEKAANTSVVVKTITSTELESNPEWIDYADLIYLSVSNHVGATKDLYKNYNRLGKPASDFDTSYDTTGFTNKDISFATAMRIYKKVNADTYYSSTDTGATASEVAARQFAAIIIDQPIYDGNVVSKSVNLTVYDADFNQAKDRWGNLITYQEGKASNNNFYKLCVMLLSMDPQLFEKRYLDTNLIDQYGNYTKQSGDASSYWGGSTFQYIPDVTAYNTSNYTYVYAYWTSDEYWYSYGAYCNLTETSRHYWVYNHVLTYPSDRSLAQDYVAGTILPSSKSTSKFKGFYNWCKSLGLDETATSTDAVRYILNLQIKNTRESTLRVLDIEPSVKVSKNGSTQLNYEWSLTESYVKNVLAPTFQGTVVITHLTSNAFNCDNEDLQSNYDLIYMGMDNGGFNLKTTQNNGVTSTNTYFNDSSLNGKIYLHTGDSASSAEIWYNNTSVFRGVQFVYNKSSRDSATTLRYPANDITYISEKKLCSYLKSGHPIIAANSLYENNATYIDQSNDCIIKNFVTLAKSTNGDGSAKYPFSTVLNVSAVNDIINQPDVVVFNSLPNIYDGTTESSTSASIVNPNNLTTSGGHPILPFNITINKEGYGVYVYIDNDGDGKFDDEKDVLSKTSYEAEKAQNYTVYLSSSRVGLVQWEVVVYNLSNPDEKYTKTGCSAIAVGGNGSKETIHVLQICPDNTSCQGMINLYSNSTFNTYYNLKDFNIDVTVITFTNFDKLFYTANESYSMTKRNNGFAFDFSEPISETNPKGVDSISKITETMCVKVNNKYCYTALHAGNEGNSLSDYNMIVIGFGDMYGSQDFWNAHGAAEYIQYYIAQGKGILFCHDLTCFNNINAYSKGNTCSGLIDSYWNHNKTSVYGATADAMMRDIMGMNAYGMVSNQLSSTVQSYSTTGKSELAAMQDYQSAQTYSDYGADGTSPTLVEHKKYSTTAYANQGFTGFSVRRLINYSYYNGTEKNNYYLNDDVLSGTIGSKGVIQDANFETDYVSKVNEGAITQYPYKIDEYLKISSTHGQYYSLDLEDPSVTVWYTLDVSNDTEYGRLYGLSPKDGAESYYIYSKDNVFYSGVGHSSNGLTRGEAKLFVNTMIAAYRAAAEPPEVLLVGDAVENSTRSYNIQIMETYNSSSVSGDNNNQEVESFGEDPTVEFIPYEYNSKAQKTYVSIYYVVNSSTNEIAYIDTIYDESGNKITADANHEFVNLNSGNTYHFKYPMQYINNGWKAGVGETDSQATYIHTIYDLDDGSTTTLASGSENDFVRNIKFQMHDDLITDKTETSLSMSVRPLFQLD